MIRGKRRLTGGWGSAAVAAAWLGSVVGMTLFVVASALTEGPLEPSELSAIPVVIFGYATFIGLPIAFIGLLVLGLPLTFALKRWAERPWMALIALAVGGLSGRLMYHLVDQALFFGIDDLLSWRLADYGVLIGASTGLLWFLFARRVLRAQRIRDAPPESLPS